MGGATLLASYILFEPHWVAVTKYTIKIAKLPQAFDGFTMLHISDLHSKWFGEQHSKLMDIIKSLAYDVVAFTGDLDNKYAPDSKPGVELIRQLKDKPVYFVPGNHDWWTGYTFKNDITALGVNVLENRAVKFPRTGEHIWLIGVDDPYSRRDRLEAAIKDIDDTQTRLLLAHAPEIFPAATRANIDLVLVGHTHGGQVRLPFMGAVVVPGQGFFPKFDYGYYRSGATQMLINGGLGESVLPIRMNIRPELVLVTLRRGA